MASVGIIGAGAWGTALAVQAARNEHSVVIATTHEQVRQTINISHHHPSAFPTLTLSHYISACDYDEFAQRTFSVILIATPAQKLRATLLSLLAKGFKPSGTIIICCKGIEIGTHALMSEIVQSIFPAAQIAVLSGPNFAEEVARGLPTITSIATKNAALGKQLVDMFGSANFRPYWTEDVIGAEILGAYKNVLAIACGIAEGKKLGENARAALITRGLAEVARLMIAKEGHPATIYEPCGMGDVVLTCTSSTSRNMALGIALGEGKELPANIVTEGVATAEALDKMATTLSISLPIAHHVHRVLSRACNVDEAIQALLARPF